MKMRVVLALEAPSHLRAMASASAAELLLPSARAKRPRRQARLREIYWTSIHQRP